MFGSQANRAKANTVITKSLRDMRNEALAAEGMVYPLSQIYKEIYNNFESLSNIDSALSYSTNTTKYKKAYKIWMLVKILLKEEIFNIKIILKSSLQD